MNLEAFENSEQLEKIINHETHEARENSEQYAKILFKEESYAIQGAIFEVYRVMGCGFLEQVYQECLYMEFQKRDIPFQSQIELPIIYKGERLIQTYRSDFVCYGQIIVEIKAVKELDNEHRAQVFNYLKASGYRLGLLVNFGHHPRVAIERIVV